MSQSSQRARLFKEDPHCFWCGCLTTLDVTNPRLATLATVEHLYSRQHPARQHKKHLKVLACFSCNQNRNNCEHKGVPFTPALAQRVEIARKTWAVVDHSQIAAARQREHAAVMAAYRSEQAQQVKRENRDLRMTMRVICTLEEAVEFAREHPAR